ncbi:YceI family protein [uncultured Cardiobacterium sp.]|jgi:hypothetical protein|uniref:YceI family protein n=1 Tax=uncultured Cardiobacterium sp. TaxID=417619 RepID=UPI00261EA128|nr:YceI family protein [uncultured Cardiobacterium sp.]
MKKTLVAFVLALFTAPSFAGQCDFTPDKDKFAFSFTAYGFPDKSYDVKDNTFTDYELSSESGKLLNAGIVIKTASVDTTADKRNWDRSGEWPDATLHLRNQNIVTGLFKAFANGDTISAKIKAIDEKEITLSVTMNDVTKEVAMPYVVEDGLLKAKGTFDIMDFDAQKAWTQFNNICSSSWHQGKTWTDIDIAFSVPVQEKGCQ